MTKNIFTTAIMAATFMLATAQIPFEVPTPSWQYLANPTSESGINIRISPSATAPRMLYDETKIEYFYIPLIHYAYWSTATPKGSIHPILMSSYEYAPIVGEQNGWYELEGVGVKGSNGWVSAKLCNKVTPQPITAADLNNDYYRIIESENGTYAFSMYVNEMDQDVTFELGKLVNGYLICPYQLYAAFYEKGATTAVKKDDNGNYSFLYTDANSDEFGCPILKGIPDSLIKDIMAKMTKKDKPTITCKIDGEMSSF